MTFEDATHILDSSQLKYKTNVISFYHPESSITEDYLSTRDNSFNITDSAIQEYLGQKYMEWGRFVSNTQEEWISSYITNNSRTQALVELGVWGLTEVPLKIITIDNYPLVNYRLNRLTMCFIDNTFHSISFINPYAGAKWEEYDTLMNEIYEGLCVKYGMPYQWYYSEGERLDQDPSYEHDKSWYSHLIEYRIKSEAKIQIRSPLQLDSWKKYVVEYAIRDFNYVSKQSLFTVRWSDGPFQVRLEKRKYYDTQGKEFERGEYIGFIVKNSSETVNLAIGQYKMKISTKEEEIRKQKQAKIETEISEQQKRSDALRKAL